MKNAGSRYGSVGLLIVAGIKNVTQTRTIPGNRKSRESKMFFFFFFHLALLNAPSASRKPLLPRNRKLFSTAPIIQAETAQFFILQ